MSRPPFGPGEEFIHQRLKHLNSERFRDYVRSGKKPPGVIFSESSISMVCVLVLAAGVALITYVVLYGL